MTEPNDCDLCEAAQFTHWYYQDDVCWIADCEVCSVPMVVWKPHGTEPSDEEVSHMIERLKLSAQQRFGDEPFEVDRHMRQIPEHWHAHARDADWFRLRMARPLSRFTGVGADRQERGPAVSVDVNPAQPPGAKTARHTND